MFLLFLYLRFLIAVLRSDISVHAFPASDAALLNNTDRSVQQQPIHFRDDFHSFNRNVWKCEYTCPTVVKDVAEFRLKPGIKPRKGGSWTKATYKGRRFVHGKFIVRFSLTARPEQKVWWGVALWDNGANPDKSKYNEINFGYTTDQSYNNTQLRFESAKTW